MFSLQSEMFQEDIFPPCEAGKPSLTAEEWIAGTDKDPWLVKFTRDGLQDMTLEESQIVSINSVWYIDDSKLSDKYSYGC